MPTVLEAKCVNTLDGCYVLLTLDEPFDSEGFEVVGYAVELDGCKGLGFERIEKGRLAHLEEDGLHVYLDPSDWGLKPEWFVGKAIIAVF